MFPFNPNPSPCDKDEARKINPFILPSMWTRLRFCLYAPRNWVHTLGITFAEGKGDSPKVMPKEGIELPALRRKGVCKEQCQSNH
jgi:hypothetical protein